MSTTARPTRLVRAGKWVLLLGVLVGMAFGARRAVSGASVHCVQAHRGPLKQRLVLTGRVITPGTARLGVVTLGTVKAVHVDAGSHVTAGQPLLELTDMEQRAAVAQARAGVLLSAAQMGQVKRITNQIAGASVDEARVAVDQARREFQRTEQLARSDSVSAQVVDTARDAVTAAESRLAAAEARAAGARGPESQVAVAKNAEA
ncbi:MAG TPA: biotin/lipoyl-binding protein, partial [Polyangiaceae bacterium]|nr:biotin/lipoyl-binding protein [Polyangiaceae bacterium]